jgi:hypothetical protein
VAEPTLDAFVRHLVREELGAVLRLELAPIRGALNALARGAAVGPISLDAAAPALGKSPATLRRLAAAGKLPGAIRIGRSWRIDLAACRPKSPEEIAQLASETGTR